MTAPVLAVTEIQLLDQILDYAGILHWQRLHIRPGQTINGWRTPVSGDGTGYPDLTMLRAHRLVIAELKAPRTVTVRRLWDGTEDWRERVDMWEASGKEPRLFGPGQVDWLTRWDTYGAEVHVWTPSDHDWECIKEILR